MLRVRCCFEDWSGLGRQFAVVMEPALVAALPPCHRLHAAQNRASAAACAPFVALIDGTLSHLHHLITGPLHSADRCGRVSLVEEEGDARPQGQNADAVRVVYGRRLAVVAGK